jgi:CRP/FNR family transcriptional regulator
MRAPTDDPDSTGHLDVLAAIPAEYRDAVIEQCERRTFRRAQTVWAQGEPAEYVAFVVKGKAMSMYQSPTGKMGTTGFWCTGDIIGAGDLGSRTTRQMTVKCLEPCTLYTLAYTRFNSLIDRFPELAHAIIHALSLRLRWVARLAVILETESGHQRISEVLLALADRFGVPSPHGTLIDLKLTHEDLASISGVSRQYANITIGDLRKRGLVRLEKRSIILTDYGKLAATLSQPG